MDAKYIKSIQDAWISIHEKKKKKLDPVDDKELDGDHDDRDDKDIDNDGDTDSSDEYLHKKRKAIKKAKSGEEEDNVTESSDDDDDDGKDDKKEFPFKKKGKKKKDDDKDDDDDDDIDENKMYNRWEKSKRNVVGAKGGKISKAAMKRLDQKLAQSRKESYIRHEELGYGEVIRENEDGTLDALFEDGVYTVENKQTKGATKPEGIMDKESPKSKKFAKDHEGGVADDAQKGIELVSKAGATGTKQAPNRGNDNRKGDLKPVLPKGK